MGILWTRIESIVFESQAPALLAPLALELSNTACMVRGGVIDTIEVEKMQSDQASCQITRP